MRAFFVFIVLIVLGVAAYADETITYTYDARGRLIQTAHSGTVNNAINSCYALDRADNRTSTTVASCPSFSVNDVSANEGSSLIFTISKSGSGAASVNYATANGTATGADYTAASGTLSFLASDTSKTVSVATIDDTTAESNETVLLNLSGASGATISDSQGVGTILDNDSASCAGVSFTIASNGAVTEGTNSVFTVTKSGTTSNSCSVNYATANGTATAPGDYTSASGTLTFTSAQTSKTVSVTTIQDALSESAETFTMSLSSPTSGATLGTPSSATATINNGATNHPPTTVSDSATVHPCELVIINVVANDTDVDGDYPLSVVSVNGTGFDVASSTSVSYQDDGSNPGGNVGAVYVVRDSRGAQASGSVTVSILSGQCP